MSLEIEITKYLGMSVVQRRDYFIKTEPRVKMLEDRLLALGGERVIYMPELMYLDEILSRGKSYPANLFEFANIAPSACHAISHTLWKHQSARIATGYALSDDGLWRSHSFPILGDRYMEVTTHTRLQYYAFELTDQEAKSFKY